MLASQLWGFLSGGGPQSVPAAPVQPLRLTYHHVGGTVSDRSGCCRRRLVLIGLPALLTVRNTLAGVRVEVFAAARYRRRNLRAVASQRCLGLRAVGNALSRRHVPATYSGPSRVATATATCARSASPPGPVF